MRRLCGDHCDRIAGVLVLIVIAGGLLYALKVKSEPIVCCDGSDWPGSTRQGACSGRHGILGGKTCEEWKKR